LTVGTYLAVTIGAGVLINLYSWVALPVRPHGRLPMRPLLGFGVRAIGAQVASFGNRQLDQVFLVSLVPTRQLGLYAVAATLSTLPLAMGQAIGSRAFGEVATAEDEGRTAARYTRFALVAGLVFSALLALAAPIGVPLLYGQAFRGAVVPLLLLLPGTVAFSYSATANQALVSMGRPGTVTLTEVAGLAVTLVGLITLVPILGVRGAALTSSAAYFTRAITQAVALRRAGVPSMRPRASDFVEFYRRTMTMVQRFNPIAKRARRRQREARRAARLAAGGGADPTRAYSEA
jgi:O-antigen/teichoic acid export membrane protein